MIILGQPLLLSSPEEIFPTALPSSALPEDTLAARYAFSDALARSTALSAIETGVEEFLSSVSRLPHTLSSTGKPGLNRTEIIKKMGLLLKFRQRIFLNPQNFTDTPETYWSEAALESSFLIKLYPTPLFNEAFRRALYYDEQCSGYKIAHTTRQCKNHVCRGAPVGHERASH